MNTFKCLFLIGTNNKNSNTLNIAKKLNDVLSTTIKNIEIEIIELSKLNIEYCTGCRTCFKNNFCIYDGIDDVSGIEQKIKYSDVVFFFSSVYLHNIPGKFKSLIDRISYKTHILEYSGKIGFTITSSFSNGEDIVSLYLSKFQTSLGIKNYGNYKFVEDRNNSNNFVNFIVDDILKHLETNNFSNNILEEYYYNYKNAFNSENIAIYNEIGYMPNYEIKFWNQPWIKRCMSFNEFLNRKNKSDFYFSEDILFLDFINGGEI